MSPSRPKRRSKAPTRAADIEWLGAMVRMPQYVKDDGAPYRPVALFWMGADGAIVGTTLAKPGELLPIACESLRDTIKKPMSGKPHTPTRIRVSSPELAETLRAGHPGLQVLCAPTPELDEALAEFQQRMEEDPATEVSYLTPEVSADAIASFFEAAAALFRTTPWKVVPDDQSLFSVSIQQLGLQDAAMSIIGQMGQSYGLILFADLDDFEAYLDAADAAEYGEEPELPPHFAFGFEQGADLAPELRKEISEHGWEVAGPGAYPWLAAIDEDAITRPPTREEVTMAEAIARALPKVLTEKKALLKAWDGGLPVLRTVSVTTQSGELEVTLCAPYMYTVVE